MSFREAEDSSPGCLVLPLLARVLDLASFRLFALVKVVLERMMPAMVAKKMPKRTQSATVLQKPNVANLP